jgi:Flp pilus assembly protein TadG
MARFRNIFCQWRRFCSEQRGAAAVEFALILTLMTVPILNVVDLAVYSWDKMQVDNAAQAAVQAAWVTCSDSSKIPATPNAYANCSFMPTAVTQAAQSTSLGIGVTVTSTTENYYCVNTGSNLLVTVGTFPVTKPSDCSAVGSSSDTPGDYVLITVSYTYSPVFAAVSIASTLTTPITRQAWMRLG